MSVHFHWEADQFHGLLATSHRDDVAPYILRYLDKRGPTLEAGCGLGRFVIFMEQQGFADVRGIDISPDAVDIVNKIAPHLNVTCGDVSDLPFEDSSIRGVVSLGVVEHFKEGPQAALREFKRVMAPGATAIITVPYLNVVRRIKHAARLYEIGRRIKAIPASLSSVRSREDVVARSLAHLGHDDSPAEHEPPAQFARWPATGPFFEYRFGMKQFEKELLGAGLSIVEMAPIDTISGMFYEFGRVLVRASADGGRALTRLGRGFNRILTRAPRVHAHMLLCVVRKDGQS